MANKQSGADGYLLLNASGASDIKSITAGSEVSVHLVVDNVSSAAGLLNVELSNNGVDWVDGYDGYVVAAGSDVNIIVDASAPPAALLRVSYDATSGTGGCDFWVCVKGRR